jgi:hypothetical protein
LLKFLDPPLKFFVAWFVSHWELPFIGVRLQKSRYAKCENSLPKVKILLGRAGRAEMIGMCRDSQPLEWQLEECTYSSRDFVGPYLLENFDESGPNVSAILFQTSWWEVR